MACEEIDLSLYVPKVGFCKLWGEGIEFYAQKYEINIGRRSKSTALDVIVGDNINISRKHAAIIYSVIDKVWQLHVYGKNGVTVKDTLYTPNSLPVALQSGDVLQFGDTAFFFLLEKGSRLSQLGGKKARGSSAGAVPVRKKPAAKKKSIAKTAVVVQDPVPAGNESKDGQENEARGEEQTVQPDVGPAQETKAEPVTGASDVKGKGKRPRSPARIVNPNPGQETYSVEPKSPDHKAQRQKLHADSPGWRSPGWKSISLPNQPQNDSLNEISGSHNEEPQNLTSSEVMKASIPAVKNVQTIRSEAVVSSPQISKAMSGQNYNRDRSGNESHSDALQASETREIGGVMSKTPHHSSSRQSMQHGDNSRSTSISAPMSLAHILEQQNFSPATRIPQSSAPEDLYSLNSRDNNIEQGQPQIWQNQQRSAENARHLYDYLLQNSGLQSSQAQSVAPLSQGAYPSSSSEMMRNIAMQYGQGYSGQQIVPPGQLASSMQSPATLQLLQQQMNSELAQANRGSGLNSSHASALMQHLAASRNLGLQTSAALQGQATQQNQIPENVGQSMSSSHSQMSSAIPPEAMSLWKEMMRQREDSSKGA